MHCVKCNIEHDGKFGSGIFCSVKCANSRTWSAEAREKKSLSNKISNQEKLKDKVLYDYICESCSTAFTTLKPVVRGRKVRCKSCKRTTANKAISSRTWSKILKRLNAKCSICSWNEASLDIHHILERKNGGTDDDTNLICLCPNCHRKAHCKLLDKDMLKKNTLSVIYPNWKKFYRISNC